MRVATALALAAALAAPAAGGSAAGPAAGAGAVSAAAYSYPKAIREHVTVSAATDSDSDGRADRVSVDVVRPRTPAGVRVPVIVVASPYFESVSSYSFDDRGVRRSFQSWLDNFFVPRGYAVAFVDLPGTFRSHGCNDLGGPVEVAGATAAVRFLAGATLADTSTGAQRATWSSGRVGMVGSSWDGTIANALAANGVPGLVTIVPVSAISSWYDYTRSNGVPLAKNYVQYLERAVDNLRSPACAQRQRADEKASASGTGNVNAFWDARNYRLGAGKVTASVLLAHGLNDTNVDTAQFGAWWQLLAANDVPRRLFLHQGDHIDPMAFAREWVPLLHAWFDHWLLGLDNGVMRGPAVTIQREDGRFTTETAWPASAAAPRTAYLGRDAASATGTLGSTRGGAEPVRIVQDGRTSSDLIVYQPGRADRHRAVFLTAALPSALRLSGSGSLRVRVKADRPGAAIHARLVDYGQETRYAYSAETGTQTCWGGRSAYDEACLDDLEQVSYTSDTYLITRNLADIGHAGSLRRKVTLQPGTWYDLTVPVSADDAVVRQGHRLGLVLAVETDLPTRDLGATVVLDPSRSTLTLPLTRALPPAPPGGDPVGQPGERSSLGGTRMHAGAGPLDLATRTRQLLRMP